MLLIVEEQIGVCKGGRMCDKMDSDHVLGEEEVGRIRQWRGGSGQSGSVALTS